MSSERESTPATPDAHHADTPLANSLENAASNIDDLTHALANFSRVPSPEPDSALTCCCGREQCENLTAWLASKSRLESRLILSAEVGQALLQRHEAYLRRHTESAHRLPPSESSEASEDESHVSWSSRVLELEKENSALHKRLTKALVNTEVTEVSNKTILQELQEAKTSISRLSMSAARSVGWDTRLSAAMKERDDMQQERDSESQRARLAESRFAALKDKTSKLQADVRRLQDELQERRSHRSESSELLIQDARSKLNALHQTIGAMKSEDSTEFTNIIQSLVDDNELLKKDNVELQNLLAESREDFNELREELEEQRARAPSRASLNRAPSPAYRFHHYSGSVPSSMLTADRRPVSLERRSSRRTPEPQTPETNTQTLPTSPYQIEFQDLDADPASPEKRRTHKPLFLLSRSRAVQTDPWPSPVPTPGPAPSATLLPSPGDPRSETSSFSESTASHIGILIERISAFLTRMTQADALTLTNRLKRQHLRGADVGHLSRSTVSNIIAEVTGLRAQFRALLEDEKVVTAVSRKEFRALFKLFREFFVEIGELRVTLNEIILDPSVAPRVSELALKPDKAGKDASPSAGGWFPPISKLFGSPSAGARQEGAVERVADALGRSTSTKGNLRPQKFVPKLGPALAATSTTVNVEFSGSGVGKAVANTFSAHPASLENSSGSNSVVAARPVVARPPSSGVMNIFAGAPRQQTPDAWVVLRKAPRRMQSTLRSAEQFAGGANPNRMSRNVDAVVDLENAHHGATREDDGEEADDLGPLLTRTLRRRGLSDSSIHSTYTQHEDGAVDIDRSPEELEQSSQASWQDRTSVLQALGRRMQSFRLGAASVVGTPTLPQRTRSAAGAPETPSNSSRPETSASPTKRSSSTTSSLLPDFTALEAASDISQSSPFFIGSPPRDESSLIGPSLMERTRRDVYHY